VGVFANERGEFPQDRRDRSVRQNRRQAKHVAAPRIKWASTVFPLNLIALDVAGFVIKPSLCPAVLVAALVDDFSAFSRDAASRKRETSLMAMSFPFARTVICGVVSRASQSPSKLIKFRSALGLGFTVLMMIGTRGINDDRHGLSPGTAQQQAKKKNARRRKHQAAIRNPAILDDSLHSPSSVAIRSDFRNRTSWGVMASRGAGFLSFSSKK